MLEGGVRLGMYGGNPYLPSHHDDGHKTHNPPEHIFRDDDGYPIAHHNPMTHIKHAEQTLFDILKGVRASLSDYSSEVKAKIVRFKNSISAAYELDYGSVHLKVNDEISGWQKLKIDQSLIESLARDIKKRVNDVPNISGSDLSNFIRKSSSADMGDGLYQALLKEVKVDTNMEQAMKIMNAHASVFHDWNGD
jgi:hypothetical protein